MGAAAGGAEEKHSHSLRDILYCFGAEKYIARFINFYMLRNENFSFVFMFSFDEGGGRRRRKARGARGNGVRRLKIRKKGDRETEPRYEM